MRFSTCETITKRHSEEKKWHISNFDILSLIKVFLLTHSFVSPPLFYDCKRNDTIFLSRSLAACFIAMAFFLMLYLNFFCVPTAKSARTLKKLTRFTFALFILLSPTPLHNFSSNASSIASKHKF